MSHDFVMLAEQNARENNGKSKPIPPKPEPGDPITWVAEITPAQAQALLETSPGNRKLSRSLLAKLEHDLKRGNWAVLQPIIIDWNDKLRDGHHRLTAVVNTGITARFNVLWGVDPNDIGKIDTGKSRSAANMLQFANIKNANSYAAVSQVVNKYLYGNERLVLTPEDQLNFVQDNLDLLEESTSVYYKGKWRNTFIAVVFLVLSKSPQMRSKLEEFSKQLRDETGQLGDPVHTFIKWVHQQEQRYRFSKRATIGDPFDKLKIAGNVWKYWSLGQSLKYIKPSAVCPNLPGAAKFGALKTD